MPSTDHPWLLAVATIACLLVAFPLARYFFGDLETLMDDFGLSRDSDRAAWLLGFVPGDPNLYFKVIGFLGLLFVVFVAVFSLGMRLAGAT
jgi:hypothetical protein